MQPVADYLGDNQQAVATDPRPPPAQSPAMNRPSSTHVVSSPLRLLRLATSLGLLLSLLAASVFAQNAATGRVSGTVVSKGSGNALQGAVVSVPALNKVVLSDDKGEFILRDLPPGAVELVASYSSFEDLTQRVVVESGKVAEITLALASSDVIQLEPFTVESVKEGQALAITQQRNAENIKNVTALDEWGVLPTQNVGELFTRLPGISFTTDEDNLINNITVRGMVSGNGQSFTRLNIDGMSSTGVGGNGRTATLHSFSAAMYEQLEVILGQTPDKRADALGGQINLKTRSPLAMREKRRFNYSLSGRYTPSSAERSPALAEHPRGYSTTLNYTEIFDFAGGVRNFGISVNAAHQQVVNQFDFDVLQYSGPNLAIPSGPVYLRDYDKRSGVNHRFISGFSVRADYRPWDHTTITANFLYNTGDEPYFHYTFVNPFFNTNATVFDAATNPNGGIMPGSTATRTEIRPTGNAQMLLTPRRWSFTSTNPTSTLRFEHNFGKLKIDHTWRVSETHWDSNSGREREGGQLSLRTNAPIGFILDNGNVRGKVFSQTAGPSIYDPASYAAIQTAAVNTTTIPVAQTSVNLVKRGYVTDTIERAGNINASYLLDFAVPITFKTGIDGVNRKVDGRQVDNRRWYARVGTVLRDFALMPLTTFEDNHGGARLPVFDPVAVSRTLTDANVWYEDVNFNATQPYSAARYMNESVAAGYIQAQTKFFNRLTVLGGVRVEDTEVETATWFARTTRTPIATEPDHYRRAARDFVRATTEGGYTKRFPSLHVAYDFTSAIKFRGSWSTSYGRPDLLQLIPGVTISDTAQTVTIGNPDLKPQLAKNVDLKLEYYTPSNGLFSASVFEKRISDYLSANNFRSGVTVPNTPDNGFDGLYGGYEIIRPLNLGQVNLKGWELDFRQRLSFLPGAFRGLVVRGNYTYLEGKGELFFSTAQTVATKRKTREIPGIVPRTANLGFQYNKGKWGASFDLNHTGDYADFVLQTVNLNTPDFFQYIVYRKKLTTMNAGVTYRLRPTHTLYVNVSNITGEGPERYVWLPERIRAVTVAPLSIVAGIQGTF
jgi:TonB-dependent receptor